MRTQSVCRLPARSPLGPPALFTSARARACLRRCFPPPASNARVGREGCTNRKLGTAQPQRILAVKPLPKSRQNAPDQSFAPSPGVSATSRAVFRVLVGLAARALQPATIGEMS